MKKNREDDPGKARLAAKLTAPPLGFDAEQTFGVRLRKADIARLFGCSPARITQLCQEGKIPVLPNGRIDPSQAAHALLKNSDPKALQLRILAPLRERIAQSEADAAASQVLLGRAQEEAAELRGALRAVVRRWLEVEAWLQEFQARAGAGEELDAAFDAAGEAALGAPLSELAPRVDPDLVDALLVIDPDLLAEDPCN